MLHNNDMLTWHVDEAAYASQCHKHTVFLSLSLSLSLSLKRTGGIALLTGQGMLLDWPGCTAVPARLAVPWGLQTSSIYGQGTFCGLFVF
jgi:hypothetical protein